MERRGLGGIHRIHRNTYEEQTSGQEKVYWEEEAGKGRLERRIREMA